MAPTPQRYPSSGELDLQARRESDVVPARRVTTSEPTTVYAPFATESTETTAYVGVNPEYMTHANDTEKPLRADGGVEADAEKDALDGEQYAVAATTTTAADLDTKSVGSGSSTDSVYTGNSGEGFTAQKVVAPEPEVKEETVEPEAPEVVVPVVPTQAPTEPTATPANTTDSPADAPPTPAGETDGPKVKAKTSR